MEEKIEAKMEEKIEEKMEEKIEAKTETKIEAKIEAIKFEIIIKEEEYLEFTQPYRDAMSALQVKLEVLNLDYRRKYANYPIHYIQSRLKKKESIEKKLALKNMEISVQSAQDNLTDIAGVRVICYFEEDVYTLVNLIKKQSDMIVIKECDYIEKPKTNGYRSYHLVLGIPVYHTDGKQYYPVEIQFRTMSMDFWASMEHRICYKADEEKKQNVRDEFMSYSCALEHMEKNMYAICKTSNKIIVTE